MTSRPYRIPFWCLLGAAVLLSLPLAFVILSGGRA